MARKNLIIILAILLIIFVAQAEINNNSIDSIPSDSVSANYDINALKKLGIDSIQLKYIPVGEMIIYQDYYTVPEFHLHAMPANKFKITRALVDSVIYPIDSLFIKRSAPIRVGYKDLGLPKGDMVSSEGPFLDYRIYMHDGRILKDVEYFPNNTGRKKIIYSENVDKLLKFLDNHLSDPVYINDSTLYINCLYKNSK